MFDANSYRKEVLKPLLDRGEHDVSDPFTVVGLDPSVDDEDLIRQRMGEVVAFWRKEQSSPRYKGLVSSLLKQQDAISAQLLDANRRAEARARVQGASETADAAAAARVDELLDALERRHGGIPRDRLDRLRSLAAREGISGEQIDARLVGRTLIDERADTIEPIPASQRKQVTSLLAELERLDRDADAHRTLYGFLGLPVGAATDVIEGRREAIDARNRQRRHDRLRTVVDELLALSETLLVSGDPRRYLAGIEEGVKEDIRPAIETAVLLEDRVSAAESERLTREAVSAGLDPGVARDLVVEVARELHAAIDVGSIADYVVCATCNATNTAGAAATCTRCGSDLYRDCPRCGTRAARSDVRCSSCRFDLRAYDEAAEDLERAAADIDAGRLGAAAERIEQAAAWGDDLPDLVRLRERVDAAGRTADDAWDNLTYALDTARVDDARRYLTSLGRIASDRPAADGTTIEAATERVEALEAELAAAVAEAAGTEDVPTRETALLEVLDRFPGASAIAEGLADVGVRPATDVAVDRTGGTLTVRWSASPSPGPVEYRVVRTVDRSGGASTPLGRTTATELEDAGAPAGEPVTYAVVAARLGITAPETRSEPVVPAPDVAGLEAVEHDGAVELRWRRVRAGEIWVERTQPDDPDAMTRKLRGGPTGVLDSAVRSGTRYRYLVTVEYPATATSGLTRSDGVSVDAMAFALPDAPPAPTVAPSGKSITVTVPAPDPGVEAVVLRARAAPAVASGAVIDDDARRAIGGALAGSGGTAYDGADGGPRWYVPVYAIGGQNVVGPAVAHPGVAEVEHVTVAVDDTGPIVRWEWPAGCTEAVIHWSAGTEPVVPGGPGVTENRTTNTAYDIHGGWRPPGVTAAPLQVLVLAAGRIDGQRVALPGWSDAARGRI
ncbi:MAG TPA: hypothetical protein VK507_14435 [Iamia sp.]|nr:hypothetical protein [Iamia sp.]